MFVSLILKSYFIVGEVFLITVKIILSLWTGRWLDPLLVWKPKKLEILPAAPLAGSVRCLILANVCPKNTLELTGQPFFPEGVSEREGTCSLTWGSYQALSLPFMKGQSREQHVACINPSPAAALGTSRSQFMLFDFTDFTVMQRICSSIRYCSYFITLEIETRNMIIDLYVGYHCEQENKWFGASVCQH